MVWDFFIDNIPSWKLIFGIFPFSLLYGITALYTSGWLKLKAGWKTGYSRKLFHFSIFLAAGIVQVTWGYPGTIVFGSTVSLVIFYAIYKGDGNLLFEAMAREKDAPKRAHYILMPYIATLFGGVLSNFLFLPEVAVFGYLIAGFGDAIAEPIGTRFGRHKYRVPTFTNVVSYRSLEGSAAVFAGSCVALIIGALLGGWTLSGALLVRFAAIALISMIIEGLSPHGWDNFTLQVLSCLACFLLLF